LIVTISLAAKADIEKACSWFEAAPGLGTKSIESVDQAVAKTARNPLTYRKVKGEKRRVNVEGFHALFYKVERDAIVIACIHARRDPKLVGERASGVTPIKPKTR
jgi:hypothetical protein